MASPPLRLSPLHCVSRRSILAVGSRRNVLSSIRLKSTDVSQGAQNTLPWSDYLAIRRGKRKWEMVSWIIIFWAMFPTMLTGILIIFSLVGVDYTVRSGRISGRCRVLWFDGAGRNEAHHGARTPPHMGIASFIFPQGIDPLLFFGGATLGCMGMYLCSSCHFPRSPSFSYLGAGYLVGPILGSTLWRVTHRRTMALIEQRDREFHQHIVKNRVDPRAQSATNPVPDFYGESPPDPVYDMYRSMSLQEKKLAPSINIDRSGWFHPYLASLSSDYL
jgi:import inner membrane translocase subunit TIM23